MVDYLKTSMSMRSTWPLKPDDQKVFEDFDFVSTKVFEEELERQLASTCADDPFGTAARLSGPMSGLAVK